MNRFRVVWACGLAMLLGLTTGCGSTQKQSQQDTQPTSSTVRFYAGFGDYHRPVYAFKPGAGRQPLFVYSHRDRG